MKTHNKLNTFSDLEIKNQKKFSKFRDNLVSSFAFLLKKIHIIPDYITILGIIFLFPYLFIYQYNPSIAFLFIIPYLFCDGLDGSYARVTNTTTPGGALLDLIADHLGLVASVVIVIQNNLAPASITAYYGMTYIALIAFTVWQNSIGIKVRYIFRSKYVLFLTIGINVFFDINLIPYLIYLFSITMTFNCFFSYIKLKKKLNNYDKSI